MTPAPHQTMTKMPENIKADWSVFDEALSILRSNIGNVVSAKKKKKGGKGQREGVIPREDEAENQRAPQVP